MSEVALTKYGKLRSIGVPERNLFLTPKLEIFTNKMTIKKVIQTPFDGGVKLFGLISNLAKTSLP